METKTYFSLLEKNMQEVDVSIPLESIESFKIMFKDLRIKERLIETNELLNDDIKQYTDLMSCTSGERVSVKVYLDRHPDVVKKYFNRNVKRWGLEWIEKLRRNNDSERKFLENARDIYYGNFGEIFQTVVALKNHRLEKYVATSSRADGVDEKDIQSSIPRILPFGLKDVSSVMFIHNHPDLHRDTKISPDYTGEAIGYVSASGLSKKDIELADRIYNQNFRGKCKTFVIAISENGLTYAYQAGTSKEYKLRV